MPKNIHILYIGNKLSAHGFTPTGIEYLGRGLEEGGFRVSYSSNILNPMLRLGDMLLAIARNRTCDLILIDTYSSAAFYFAWCCGNLAHLFGIPFILILRGGDLPARAIKSPGLTRKLFLKAARVVAVSKYLEKAFDNFEAITYIPNTIDISKYPFELRHKVNPKLLWVRSLHNIYNPELAIRIVSALKEDYLQATLAMVGPDKDGSLAAIDSLIKSLDVSESIKVTGKLSKDEWISLSVDYDIFINTTNFDNMPVSVIEAMALGLPVVSTNVGGMPFLISQDVDGLLVPPNNPEAFLDAIKRLLTDPALASSLAKNARKKAESFDNGIVLQQWKNLIHEVVQQRS